MEMITVTAKTVEDAITQASMQLGVSSDKIQYEVVEKGSAGLLGGLIGAKPAVIRAKKVESIDSVHFFIVLFQAACRADMAHGVYLRTEYVTFRYGTRLSSSGLLSSVSASGPLSTAL